MVLKGWGDKGWGEQVSNKCCLILECSDVLWSSLNMVLFEHGGRVNRWSINRPPLYFRGMVGENSHQKWNKIWEINPQRSVLKCLNRDYWWFKKDHNTWRVSLDGHWRTCFSLDVIRVKGRIFQNSESINRPHKHVRVDLYYLMVSKQSQKVIASFSKEVELN